MIMYPIYLEPLFSRIAYTGSEEALQEPLCRYITPTGQFVAWLYIYHCINSYVDTTDRKNDPERLVHRTNCTEDIARGIGGRYHIARGVGGRYHIARGVAGRYHIDRDPPLRMP